MSYTTTQIIEAWKLLDQLELDYVRPGFPATGGKDQRVIVTLAVTVDEPGVFR